MIEHKYVGFVCNKVNYKDNDAIFSVLTSSKKEVFKARGILKITSKNAASCNYFMISEFVTQSKTENSNQTLKSASLVKIYKKPHENLLVSGSYLFICSILEQISDQINGYDIALKCFDYLEDNIYPINVLNYFLKHLCNALGYQSNLKGCVNCFSKTNLISFDFETGGFICKNCYDSSRYEKMSAIYLKTIYEFLKEEELSILDELVAQKIFKMYCMFLKDVMSISLTYYEFVLKCL